MGTSLLEDGEFVVLRNAQSKEFIHAEADIPSIVDYELGVEYIEGHMTRMRTS